MSRQLLHTCRVVVALCLLVVFLHTATGYAQPVPDAGRLLRDQSPATSILNRPTPIALPGSNSTLSRPNEGGPRIVVQQFHIRRATLYSETELNEQLADLLGRELNFSELQNAPNRLVDYYKQRGYLVRAFFPPQDVVDGHVELVVVEGKFGSIHVEGDGVRTDRSRIAGIVSYRQARGTPVDLNNLTTALAILSEQPGLSVQSTLTPGSSDGDTDLYVRVSPASLFSYSIQTNNNGNLATGYAQVGGNASVSNASGLFDLGVLTFNTSEGMNFLRGDYSIAAGNSGLRVGLNIAKLQYRFTQAAFLALEGKGSADSIGFSAQYPWVRRDMLNLGIALGLDRKAMQDFTLAGETTNKSVNVFSIGISGMALDALMSEGSTAFGINVAGGDIDLSRNANSLSVDETTRQTQGGFAKIGYNVSRQQNIFGSVGINANIRGQVANKNLDPSEQFSLGGPSGIRAYPVGEASGDSGWLAKLVAKYALSKNLSASVFFETGHIQLNKSTWANWNAGNVKLPNEYDLSGAGVGLDWITGRISINAAIAGQLGDNPRRENTNTDADGGRGQLRGWISAVAQF